MVNALVLNLFGIVLCVLVLATGLVWWRNPAFRRGLRPLLGLELLLVLLSLPLSSYLMLGSLEWGYPERRSWPDQAQAIVILAGSLLPADDVRLQDELGLSTYGRCHHGLEVYHATGVKPVLVTGGSPHNNPAIAPAAQVMRDYLVEAGVPAGDILVEGRSQTTYENAVESAKLLHERGIQTVILVTDAVHMPRAVRVFRAQGLKVVPSACNHRATGFHFKPATEILPSPASARMLLEAAHEWVGLVWYTLKGWTG